MKKVIVTGANGFVGSAVCDELIKQDIEVIAVIRNENSDIRRIEALPNIRIIYCSLENIDNLELLIPDRDVDTFYHFAWNGSAGKLRGSYETQINNVLHTCDAVRVCKKLGCHRFVFASSIMEYEIETVMKTEQMPEINTLYSSAKVEANYMARTISASLDIEYIRGVISNIYGPLETSPRLINTSIRKMLRGEHCSFSHGEQMYDFIYISDAAKTFVAIGEKGVANRTYYIGSLSPKPLRDFLLEMRDQVDDKIQIGLGEIEFNGVSLQYNEFDIEAVKRDTGFEPQIDFVQGIQNTIDWIRGEMKDV